MDEPITYEQSLRYPPRDYDEGNRTLIHQAYRRWKTGQYDAVTFKCFNREEDDKIKAYAAEHYPDMVLRVSWMVPKGLNADR
jgi:hypothetical protein